MPREDTEAKREKAAWRRRQRLESCCRGAGNDPGYEPLEEGRKLNLLEASGRGQPNLQADLGLLVSKNVREQSSPVLSHPVCGILLQQSWDTNTASNVDLRDANS